MTDERKGVLLTDEAVRAYIEAAWKSDLHSDALREFLVSRRASTLLPPIASDHGR